LQEQKEDVKKKKEKENQESKSKITSGTSRTKGYVTEIKQ
jgi:hypothetical protein